MNFQNLNLLLIAFSLNVALYLLMMILPAQSYGQENRRSDQAPLHIVSKPGQYADKSLPPSKTECDEKNNPKTIIWHKCYRHIDPKTGYRTSYYRAGLPSIVPGGMRVNIHQVKQHFDRKSAIFVDVMAHTGAGYDPFDGTWRLSEPRKNIPGSIWLPDIGTGTLSHEMVHFFKSNLFKISNGDKSKLMIFYCTSDCWMAWNAIRRAARWGYQGLLWYPEGTEEWEVHGFPLNNSIPVPLKIKEDQDVK